MHSHNVEDCPPGFVSFTANDEFRVPCGVSRVRVLAVGGGSGGGSGNAGGGASGYVKYGEFAVEPGITISVIIGAGGLGSNFKKNDLYQDSKAGGRSSFGLYISAEGGGVACSMKAASGGSGGGEGCEGPCWSGAGGSGGSDGNKSSIASQQCHSPGSGQQSYEPVLQHFKRNALIPGAGGRAVFLDFPGGGGAGGLLINGRGPTASKGKDGGAYGGIGYGAGGGGGYLNRTSDSNGWNYHPGGTGASGLVYIEWYWKGETRELLQQPIQTHIFKKYENNEKIKGNKSRVLPIIINSMIIV